MTKAELIKMARSFGVHGAVSQMTKSELTMAIAKRRTYLAKPAADLPKTKGN